MRFGNIDVITRRAQKIGLFFGFIYSVKSIFTGKWLIPGPDISLQEEPGFFYITTTVVLAGLLIAYIIEVIQFSRTRRVRKSNSGQEKTE